MSRFIQLHALTAYPPANLNRDDTGRPKTALLGDALRLRISSQSLKRAWRMSEVFAAHLEQPKEQIGTRTKRIGLDWIYPRLIAEGVDPDLARTWSVDLQRAYGEPAKLDERDPSAQLQNSQLVHVSPVERAKLEALVSAISANLRHGTKNEAAEAAIKAVEKRNKTEKQDKKKEKKANAALAKELSKLLLVESTTSVDVALFGRMLASVPQYSFDASVQVAHAVTVHKAAVEDDYFSAVDDLNSGVDDLGAGHIDERGYGAGLFYLYVCIDRELLLNNLGGDLALRNQALAGLLHALTQVAPTGMQNSFGSRARASYLLAEKGAQQPRSLVQAFVRPVKPWGDHDLLGLAVQALTQRRENFDKVYGPCADARCHFDVERGEGSLAEVVAFVQD